MIIPVLRNTLKNTQKKSVEGLNVGDAVVLECDSRFGLKKGDTGVVSKNSDGYVSAKMDKDGSLIGFRVEENPFKKVVTEGGDASSDAERMDAEYMEAVKSGDIGKCASMVEAAAKNNLRGTQVVDGKRNPLKVYHSSRNKNLKSFDLGFVPAGNVGFHFGPKEIADVIHRTKPGNHEPKAYYLDILSPMTFSEDCFGTSDCLFNELAVTGEILNHIRRGGQAYAELRKEFERMDAIVNDDYDSKYTDERYGYSDPKLHKLLLDTLYEAGYDGIVYANSCEGSGDICWIALDPHQVKSADPITYYDDGTVVPLSKRFDQYSEMVDESRAGDDVVARIMELVSKYDSGDLSANGVADGIAALSRETEVPEPVIRFTKAFETSVETLGSDSEGFDETIGSEYVDDIRDWCGNPVNEKTVCESNMEISDDAYLAAAKTKNYKLCRKMVEGKAKVAFAGSRLVTKDGMPIKLYHGTAFNIHKFEGGLDTITWVTPDIDYADVYADYDRHPDADNDGVIMSLYVYARNMVDIGDINEPFSEEGVRRIAKAIGCTYDELKSSIGKYSYDFLYEINEYVASIARKKGIDILVAKEGDLDRGVKRKVITIGVLDFNNIKSADPVTKYEDGTIVPLSKRFDFGTDDIREDTEEPVPPESAAEIPPEEKKVELEKPCWKNPDDWKKDEFLVEFKHDLGYRDEYFPTKSYSDCADSVAREYTLEMPTDTEAREIEGDAVMLLIKSGLKDSIKVAHELGEIVMGNRKGGPRNKKLLKAMQKAYHELVTCSARFDNDDMNESEESDSAFERWFRSSVVKDASGKPLVVYHGSSKSGITEFNEVRSGNGIFFTSSKEVANDYAVGKENQMYPCYLRIEHPFVIDAHGSKWSDMKFKEHRAVAKHAGYRWITPLEVIGYVTEVYQNEHPECDGIIIRNVVDTNASKVCADDYIVFNPKQIKSVDNGSTFSDNTANIFESRV